MPFEIPREPAHKPVRTVRIGATAAEGGSRTSTVTLGGATAMPFHLFEGAMPHAPVVAMEVFDTPPKRYPKALHDVFGDVLGRPAEMARRCVRAVWRRSHQRAARRHPSGQRRQIRRAGGRGSQTEARSSSEIGKFGGILTSYLFVQLVC